MKEENFISQTGTYGPTLEKREYSEDEQVVLRHFFTNIDRNIYAATDAMPNALWALLEGGYSRSQVSMRMRFLEIFQDMQKECEEGKFPEAELVTITDFASQIRSGENLNMSFFLSKAEKFMRKWAVQYGHDSLKDSDVVRFAVENITQLAVPAIQEARLGAYQEKSSRYVPFSKESLVVPIDLKEFEVEIREWNELLLDKYNESKKQVLEFMRRHVDSSSFKTDAAFERTINAKTLDVIRYFLPSTILTSLGIVWPTREAERHISRLMSDSRREIQEIGNALLEEGKKVSPGLLSHVAVNEYQQKRETIMRALHDSVSLPVPSDVGGRSDDAVKLLSVSPNMEVNIAAAILFEHCVEGNSYEEYVQLCTNDKELMEKVLKEYVEHRGKFDALPIPTEVGNLLFEVTVDFGAYRDLKRHRRNLFLWAPFTALRGFEYPEYVDHPELAEVKKSIELCAEKTAALHKKVIVKHSRLAEYIVMMANKQRMVWQMDPRQFVYVVELRTKPTGHYSYRTICQDMFECAKPHLPILSKYIRVDMSKGEEGRKQQEERTVEKLKALGGDVRRVS